jgi:hypothetical protein
MNNARINKRVMDLLSETGMLSEVTIKTKSAVFSKAVVLGVNIVNAKAYVDILEKSKEPSCRIELSEIVEIV